MTRMWMVPPQVMCKNHLLGEHKEIHQLVGSMKKGASIQGYIDNNLIELGSIYSRHEQLVTEMLIRNYRHKSLMYLFKFHYKYNPYLTTRIDRVNSLKELFRRCPDCRERADKYLKTLPQKPSHDLILYCLVSIKRELGRENAKYPE